MSLKRLITNKRRAYNRCSGHRPQPWHGSFSAFHHYGPYGHNKAMTVARPKRKHEYCTTTVLQSLATRIVVSHGFRAHKLKPHLNVLLCSRGLRGLGFRLVRNVAWTYFRLCSSPGLFVRRSRFLCRLLLCRLLSVVLVTVTG